MCCENQQDALDYSCVCVSSSEIQRRAATSEVWVSWLTVADVHIAKESVVLDRWQAVAEHIQAASFAHVEARRDEVILFEDDPPRRLSKPAGAAHEHRVVCHDPIGRRREEKDELQ